MLKNPVGALQSYIHLSIDQHLEQHHKDQRYKSNSDHYYTAQQKWFIRSKLLLGQVICFPKFSPAHIIFNHYRWEKNSFIFRSNNAKSISFCSPTKGTVKYSVSKNLRNHLLYNHITSTFIYWYSAKFPENTPMFLNYLYKFLSIFEDLFV